MPALWLSKVNGLLSDPWTTTVAMPHSGLAFASSKLRVNHFEYVSFPIAYHLTAALALSLASTRGYLATAAIVSLPHTVTVAWTRLLCLKDTSPPTLTKYGILTGSETVKMELSVLLGFLLSASRR